ncbi:MAG TPA: hypothetical protein VNQ76_23195 [Planctomicrobium sp.]|nr:hypothetical protein [Planctomicrobium sp.]
MSIRYRCEECGAAFKIRDSLAGTRGRCPQCRVKFDVPMESTLTDEEFAAAEQQSKNVHGSSPRLNGDTGSGTTLEPASKPNIPSASSSSKLKPPKPPAEPVAAVPPVPDEPQAPEEPPVAEEPPAAVEPEPEEFDVEEFLLDDSNPNAKKSAGLSTQPAGQDTKPATDALGRRYFGAGPKAAANAPPADEAGASVVTKATLPVEEPRQKIDWKATRKNLIKRWPILLGIVLLSGTAYGVTSLYVTPKLPLPVLSEVNGVVKVNGKPLSGVVVHLTPVNPVDTTSIKGEKLRLTDSIGVTGEAGEFQLSYLGHDGAPRGKGRIWLEPLHAADYAKIPSRFQQAGSDIRDVKEAGNFGGKFDLDLKSE